MELCRWFVRGLGIACLALGGISLGVVSLAASPAYAQTVSSIAVQGNQRVEADTIRSYFRAGPNGQLDPFQIDEGVKALFATGLFQDVRPTMQGGRLTITVIENPVINRIAFEGNKKIKDEQIKTEIQSKERGTLSRPVVQADTARLVEVYRRSGRFDIRVDPKIIELPNNRVDLVFEITEGAKTGVRQIEFIGNRAYSSSRLKDVIKTSTTGLLAFLQTNDVYDPDRVEADRELLRRFYLKHGYIDVRVVSAVGEYDPTLRGFVITFTIEEGDQYRVGTVEVQSTIRALEPGALKRESEPRQTTSIMPRRSRRPSRTCRSKLRSEALPSRLCVRAPPAIRRREPSTWCSQWMKASAPTSNGSTSGVTPARATT